MASDGGSTSGPSFSLSPEHELIRQTARDFAQREIAPIAADHDESGKFPMVTIRKMGEMGSMSKQNFPNCPEGSSCIYPMRRSAVWASRWPRRVCR